MIKNALFGLFNTDCEEFTEDNAIMTSESDSKGKFGFEDVPFSSYIVREIAAPEGYVLSDVRRILLIMQGRTAWRSSILAAFQTKNLSDLVIALS